MNPQSNVTELLQQQPHEPSINDWMKKKDFIEAYPQFTHQQMTWLLLHRETNGLAKHIRKIGKPIYIYVPGFLQWIFDRK